jgi:hypothetical protein
MPLLFAAYYWCRWCWFSCHIIISFIFAADDHWRCH